MRTIHLHGTLRASFGGPYQMEVSSVREAFKSLGCQLKGFRDAILAGNWQVYRGPISNTDNTPEGALDLCLGSVEEIHILPVVAGSKSAFGSILVGAAIFAAGIYTGGAAWAGAGAAGGALASMGAAIALGGITQMLTKAPTTSTGGAEERSSFLLNGPGQTGQQGSRLPLIYGRIRVGSIVGSAGSQIEKI